MKNIEYTDLEKISGGDFVESFCDGFTWGAGIYIIASNFWNPVGWGATVALTVGSIACAQLT